MLLRLLLVLLLWLLLVLLLLWLELLRWRCLLLLLLLPRIARRVVHDELILVRQRCHSSVFSSLPRLCVRWWCWGAMRATKLAGPG